MGCSINYVIWLYMENNIWLAPKGSIPVERINKYTQEERYYKIITKPSLLATLRWQGISIGYNKA